MVEEGAFEDSRGEPSAASDRLSLTLIPSIVNCQFISRAEQYEQYGMEIRVVCDNSLALDSQKLEVRNATITNIAPMTKYNMNVISLETELVAATVMIDFTESFKKENHIQSKPFSLNIYKYKKPTTLTLSSSSSSSLSLSLPLSLPLSLLEISENAPCSFSYTNLIFSSAILYLVTLSCTEPVQSVYPKLLTTGPDHEVFLYEQWNSGMSMFVVTVYQADILLEIPAGSLLFRNSQTAVTNLPSLPLETVTTGPIPVLSVQEEDGYFVTIQFTTSMNKEELCSEEILTVYAEDVVVTKEVEKWNSISASIRLSVDRPQGHVWAFVRAGAVHTTEGVPCRGSAMLEVITQPSLFRLTSTLDEEEEVYSNPVCGRLQAPALLQDIQREDMTVVGCWVEKFVKGSIGEMSVVDFCMHVEEEGEFMFGIAKEKLMLMNGMKNEEWMVDMIFKRGRSM